MSKFAKRYDEIIFKKNSWYSINFTEPVSTRIDDELV